MSETAMWLFPLVTYGAFGLLIYMRTGVRWLWGYCLQNTLMLAACAMAFYLLYAPHAVFAGISNKEAAAVFTWLAWTLFIVTVFLQRALLTRTTSDLALWRLNEAAKRLPLLRMLTWGPPIGFLASVLDILRLYQSGQPEAAEALLQRWRSDTRMPPKQRLALLTYMFQGRMLLQQYNVVIEQFERNKDVLAEGKVPFPYDLVARAYAENGKFAESLASIKMQLQNSPRSSMQDVDGCFIPFFSLSGACQQLSAVLQNVKDPRALPQFTRTLWQARCFSARGEAARALAHYEQALSEIPESMSLFRSRVFNWMSEEQQVLEGLAPARTEVAQASIIDEGWKSYMRARVVSDILRPRTMGIGLRLTLVSILVVYLICNPGDYLAPLSSPATARMFVQFQDKVMSFGQLDGNVWKGQWWRFLTHMFLHGNTAHLALNAGALYLFGKTVEKMYGTGKFFIIYFASGIFGGWLQVLSMPQEGAIGASGAILGIFGALIAGLIKLKNVLPAHTRKVELKFMVGVAVAQVVFDQLVNNIAAVTDKSQTGARIAAFAHAGGIVGGFILGMLLPVKRFKELETVDS